MPALEAPSTKPTLPPPPPALTSKDAEARMAALASKMQEDLKSLVEPPGAPRMRGMGEKSVTPSVQEPPPPATPPATPPEQPTSPPAKPPGDAITTSAPPADTTKPTTDTKPAGPLNPESLGLRQLRPIYEATRDAKDKLEREVAAKSTETTTLKAELDKLKVERDQAIERLERVALEHSPRFQERFNRALDRHVKTAQRFVGKEHSSEIERLLLAPVSTDRNERLSTLLSSLDPTSARLVEHDFAEVERLKLEKEDALANIPSTRDALAQIEKDTQERHIADMTARQNAAIDLAKQLSSQMDAFKPIDGNQQHNTAVAERQTYIESFLRGQLPEDAYIRIPLVIGDYFDLTERVVPTLKADLESARAALAKLQGTAPQPRSPESDHGKPIPKSGPKTEKDFIATFNKDMGWGS